jgi:hypothetical protein
MQSNLREEQKMNDRYTAICERIRERCQQQKYYGPDGGWQDYRGYFDADGRLQVRDLTHDPHTGFEFPPATEEQLSATEEAIGFSLPPMLRALYTHVANGGFGPAYGITGARGGYYFGEDGRYKTVDMCTDTYPDVRYVDLARYDNPRLIELRRGMWPAHFLHLCYWGCGEDSYIDGKSGQIYFLSFGSDKQEGFTYIFSRQENSSEEWLERWLRGEEHGWFKQNRNTAMKQVRYEDLQE